MGNCLVRRYANAYATPIAGNSIDMAKTNGMLAGGLAATLSARIAHSKIRLRSRNERSRGTEHGGNRRVGEEEESPHDFSRTSVPTRRARKACAQGWHNGAAPAWVFPLRPFSWYP